MNRPALAVMARAPVPGQVKTRLQPELDPGQCAGLYMAFLQDTIDLALSTPGYTPFLAFTPPGTQTHFDFVPGEMDVIPQTGDDLGERMHNLINFLETRGHCPVVIIGTDIPLLRPGILLAALESLTRSELCLGPSRDGGYYLVGARHADMQVFSGIPWSTPGVLTTTVRRAKEAGLSLSLLDEMSDVDSFQDLKELALELDRLRSTGSTKIPIHTEFWLKTNAGLLNGNGN